MMSDAALTERARKAGLAPDWIDASGHPKTVSADTLRTVLDTLGGYEAIADSPTEKHVALSANA